MKASLLVVILAACGGKHAETKPQNTAPSAAKPAPSECMQNCANEGPADEGGHFIYGTMAEERGEPTWDQIPADKKQTLCTDYCAKP